MKPKETKLSAWIKEVGLSEVAFEIRVDKAAVIKWRKNEVLPRDKHKVKIQKMTKGKITYKDMIDDFFKVNPYQA